MFVFYIFPICSVSINFLTEKISVQIGNANDNVLEMQIPTTFNSFESFKFGVETLSLHSMSEFQYVASPNFILPGFLGYLKPENNIYMKNVVKVSLVIFCVIKFF